ATLKVADLTEVTIPTNAFWSKDQVYEGMVTLEVYTVNPNETQSYNKRLQVFEIYEANSFEKILKSDLSSMMYIEAYDANGNILNVGPDKKIEVSIPTYGNSVEDTPLLFSFNEEMGFWNSEDEARIDGNQYTVELSHFSWWGVGSKKTATDLCITFTNVDPKVDHLFTVSTTAGKVLQLGGVNYEEAICFPALADETLEIRIYNSCFTEIFGTSVTTEMQGETNVTIDVESSTAQEYLIEIEVVDCDYATLQDTVTIFYVTDLSIDSLDKGVGTFDLTLDECFKPSEIAFIAIQDIGNVQYTFTEQVNLSEAQVQYNIQIVACQDVMPLDGHLTINGITYSKVVARRNPQETLIIATEGDDEVVIGFDGFETGTHPGRVISFKENVFCEGKVSIGHYGEIGDFVEGEFEIPSNPALGCEPITGDFRAMREK
ncbi:MAG: hypothetical protein P8M34_06690, partial [Saprospiraceae bacterium]|nr:hypothetical protein [Saprospiraceae bacterium]